MVRTALLAVVATLIGGTASPFGAWLLREPEHKPEPAAFSVDVTAVPNPHGVRMQRGGDGLFHAPVTINGRAASLIVDTGATVTVLTAADATRLGIVPVAGALPANLQTAGGASTMQWAHVRVLRLGGHEISDLYVAIVATGLDHSLLGQDVLGTVGVLRIDGASMEIS